MTRTPLLLALIAAAALAGCNGEDHNIVIGPDGAEVDPSAETNVANVQLPPSIVASHVYRCRDNSLVYVDWLNNETARIKQSREEVGVAVTKGEDGAYAADGQRLTGDPNAQTITVNGKTCRR